MSHRHLSIVVGEGGSVRSWLLRFVLEGEGYEVAAEAATVAELSHAISVHQPDIVVLSETLGTAGLELSRTLAPEAKVVLLWSGPDRPVGADAQVDPGNELRELVAAVERVAGPPPGVTLTETFDRPDWIGKVRKDPAKLREILATGRTTLAKPRVNELRTSRQVHPSADRQAAGNSVTVTAASAAETSKMPEIAEIVDHRGSMPVVTIPPVTERTGSGAPTLVPESVEAERHAKNLPVHPHKA